MFGLHNTFLITQGQGGSPRMRNQLNAVATSETDKLYIINYFGQNVFLKLDRSLFQL